jgi:flagellin
MATVDITRIASNIGALNSLNSLMNINAKLATHQTRLSTGKRINSAADDPAGLTIATKMLARSEGLKVSLDNIGDAKNMLSVAEGGLSKMSDIITQMRNKAEQAASDTLGTSERAAIQTQLSSYSQQIQDIVDQTKWNGVKLLDNSTGNKVFQTGVDEGENTTWNLPAGIDPTSMGLSSNVVDNVSNQGGDAIAALSVRTNDALGTLTELSTGDYSLEVLKTATSSTQGSVALESTSANLNGTSGLGTVNNAGAELVSGKYSITIDDIDTTGHTIDYTVHNLTDSSVADQSVTGVSTAAGALVGGALQLLDGAGGDELGVSLQGFTEGNVLVGQSMEFEYIAANQAKVELNGSDGVAVQIAQNASASLTGSYAYVSTDGATMYDTGRGIGVTMAAASNVSVGDAKTFTYEKENAYSVNVSTAARAGSYMTTANSALDKVTSALSDLGSLMARLTFKEESISTSQVNVEAGYNRIMNANMAEEQMNASKYTILQQTAISMLAQANQAPQNLLSLFR